MMMMIMYSMTMSIMTKSRGVTKYFFLFFLKELYREEFVLTTSSFFPTAESSI